LDYLKTLSLAIILCCLPALASAMPNTYTCNILRAVELSNTGHIVQHKGVWNGVVGKSFTVNRTTGEMTGPAFGTEHWLGGVKVLNRGGTDSGYRGLAYSGGNISIIYIYVAEQEKGPVKPFWGSGGAFDSVIFSGTCL